MKASGNKHDGRAAKIAPAAAFDVLGAAGESGVGETEPPLPDPDPVPPPPAFFINQLFSRAKRNACILS